MNKINEYLSICADDNALRLLTKFEIPSIIFLKSELLTLPLESHRNVKCVADGALASLLFPSTE